MKWKTFNFACAGAVIVLGCIRPPDAAGGGGMGGGGMQAGGTAGSGGHADGAPASGAQAGGAQFSGARQGGSTFFSPVQQGGQGYTHPYTYVTGNGAASTGNAAAFGTAIHEHREGAANYSAGGLPGGAGVTRSPSVVARPVTLDPGSPATVSRSAAINGNTQTSLAAPGQSHGSGPNGSAAVASTANRVLTRAAQWRHDAGHPHHHRHFVYLDNSIFLLDEGVYDDGSTDFSTGTDAFASTYEDGYYDTFDPPVVGQVEARLAAEGYYNGVMDNMLKPDLRDAIARYQQDHDLPVRGAIDEPLLKELGLL